MAWDYIIVGAGSAGCVLANRLSADTAIKVLLVEAGGGDKKFNIYMPDLAFKAMADRRTNWAFMTEPDPSPKDRVGMVPRGKLLGRSSSISATIYVRGNRGDYDHWAELSNEGWSYDELHPYFKRVEGNLDGVSEVYGKDGRVVVSEMRGVPALTHTFIDAMGEIGFPHNADYNAEPTDGAAVIHATQHRGTRYSAARGYLDPIKRHPNLKIVTGAMVRRVIFKNKIAVGIEFDKGGKTQTEHCSGAVILSASAINSPKLLMLSGIGPKIQLNALGIDVVHDNAAVGQNLREHPSTQVKAAVNVKTGNQEFNLMGKLKYAMQFLIEQGGFATYTYTGLTLVQAKHARGYPDIQFHFGAFSANYSLEGIEMQEEAAINLQPNINNSKSRGYLELRSADPHEPPKIQLNMLGDFRDVLALIEGARIGRAALQTKAFAPYLIEEFKPGRDVQTDDEWADYIRGNASGSYHPSGTCKMGVDAAAVATPDLRVIGVKGLRVVDSSIIPQIPSGNLNAISMAIGKKGSDLILAARNG